MKNRNLKLAAAALCITAVACNKKNDDNNNGNSEKLCKQGFFHYMEDSVFVAMPTAFTPNGDGKNDRAGVIISDVHNAISNYHFSITNGSGTVIFESSNPHDSWDGYINGQRANDYYYSSNLHFTANGKTVDTCSYLYALRINGNGASVGVVADSSKYVFEDQINLSETALYPTNDELTYP
ncbi:T9SS type B sorting domain-containing protein [Taibaiella soli]|uniref:Uncharacterized protein n=1 Tax=Taibaiella soli TaxID=1649169 RepID=A0A2W2A7N6_9BACT|nr:gliding motility-associated C-terminal domain-containing protein [Taibaiella soli]PZF71355.1 hypothetical protein DN068_18860 [Taibaiella soli]